MQQYYKYYKCSRCGHETLEPVGKCPKCGVTLILDQSTSYKKDHQHSTTSYIGARCGVCRTPYGYFEMVCKHCGAWIDRIASLALLILAGIMPIVFGSISIWGLMEMARQKTTLDNVLPFFVLLGVSLILFIPIIIQFKRAVMLRRRLAVEGKLDDGTNYHHP